MILSEKRAVVKMEESNIIFKAFIRQLKGRIQFAEDHLENSENEKAKEELHDILDDLQRTLED